MSIGRRRELLLLTEEEASRLAGAATQFHVPRSLLILEAIQANRQTPQWVRVPGRRSRVVCFRLPAEISEEVKQQAGELGVSQQSLLRHTLFTYLSHLSENTPRTKKRPHPANRSRNRKNRTRRNGNGA